MEATHERPVRGQGDQGAVTHPLAPGIVLDRDVRVAMRDDTHLAVTVARPDRDGRFLVTLSITAYGEDFGPKDYTTLPSIMKAGLAVETFHISEGTAWKAPDAGFWAPTGYVVVVADARGFYTSEGEPAIYSQQDLEDYVDLIE